jgi:hypothetical protein
MNSRVTFLDGCPTRPPGPRRRSRNESRRARSLGRSSRRVLGWFWGILRETDSERRPIPGALSVSVRGRTIALVRTRSMWAGEAWRKQNLFLGCAAWDGASAARDTQAGNQNGAEPLSRRRCKDTARTRRFG